LLYNTPVRKVLCLGYRDSFSWLKCRF
jgi:hypothetical protein